MARGEAARKARREALSARVRQITLEAADAEDLEFYDELVGFLLEFQKHFGKWRARRYELFHWASGSTPIDRVDLFDARGEWSIARKLEELSSKYMKGA